MKVRGKLASNLPTAYANRRQPEQLFLNIVLNALDGMPTSGKLILILWHDGR